MVERFANLDRETFERMGMRETVRGIETGPSGSDDVLTKKQLLTLIMIDNAGARGAGQIRHYNDKSYSTGPLPSSSVPLTLDEKGWARVERRKQVSRRTGRGPSGYEKKKEGGSVNVTGTTRNMLDALAKKLGFRSRFDDAFSAWARSQMEG